MLNNRGSVAANVFYLFFAVMGVLAIMTSIQGGRINGTVLIVGGIFIIAGLTPSIRSFLKWCKRKRMQENGIQLWATVERIEVKTNIKVNGRHPRNVICYYDDYGRNIRYYFKSANLYKRVNYNEGDRICVYVNPEDYSKYYVDVM